MKRRHDTLLRTFATLLVALFCGLVLEADGLRIWAERLPVGTLRDSVLPVTVTWQGWMSPLHAGSLREAALEMKSRLTSVPQAKDPAETRPALHDNDPATTLLSVRSLNTDTGVSGTTVATTLTAASVQDVAVSTQQSAGLTANWAPADGSGRVLALAGDSMMAVGLAPTLGRDLATNPNFHVLKAYRSGTGLARPEVFDWIQQYPAMLAGTQPQLVICAMGANDAQNVQIGKAVLEFGSAEWDAYYRGRLSAYLAMLGARPVRILWVGMPLMKEKKFSLKMQHMNQLIQAEIAGRPNVTWLDPNPALGYSRRFEQYRANARGKLIKMRADDGIHMTDDGAAYLLPAIREWLATAAQSGSEGAARSGVIAPVASSSTPKA
jgi:uncharacterized protein